MSDESSTPAATPAETPTETPVPAPRRRRVLRWMIGAFVVAVAFVVFLPAILSTSLAKDAIHAWLADNVDRKVEFSKLDVSWGDGIRLEGLKVTDAESPSAPLLDAPLVVVDAPLLPLLARKVLVRKFLVDGATIRVEQKSGTKTSADGVLKKKPVKKDGESETEHVLPEIHVPLEVRNLTVVIRNADGREARQTGISFTGLLDTREGPTTFDLDVPCSGGSRLTVKGSAKLFEPDGTLLRASARTVDATVTFAHLDAAQNREFVALVVGDAPVAGVLDGTIEAHTVGMEAKGSVNLRLSRLGYGDAAASAAAKTGDDLTMTGRFETGDGKFRIEGWKVRADGLVLDADLAGGLDAIDGKATIDADLARITGALRAMGVGVPGALAGRLAGSMQFARSPSSGKGELTLTGFRADGVVEGRPPVTIETARIAFAVVPSAERFELTWLTVKLADLSADARGTYTKDGTLDFSLESRGDLGGLLARVRDLGFLPEGFSVNGTLDAALTAKGPKGAVVVAVPRLVLAEKDARIEASGTRDAQGSLDFKASGSGDLGSLFGRAEAAGAGPKGIGELKGRFAFEATAKGPASALAVEVPKLSVDGDLHLDARAKLAADGALDAEVLDLSGELNVLLTLLRRMAILDRDVSLDGRIAAKASVKGTRQKPEVPHATLKLTGGPLAADVTASVDAAGAVAADVTMTADVAALCEVARRAGFEQVKAPIAGRLTATAKVAGTRDRIAAPEFKATLADGPAEADVSGRYDANGSLTATVNVAGDLDRAVALARDQGLLKQAATTGLRYTLRATLVGPPKEIEVPSVQLEVTGPLTLEVSGRADARRNFTVNGKASGAVQPLLALAAAWSGEEAKTIEGTLGGSFAAEGRPDRFDLRVPGFSLRARGLTVDVAATRSADGAGKASVKASGPIADALVLARAFGYAKDVSAAGNVEADLQGSLAASKGEASLALVATNVVVSEPKVGGRAFKEPRIALTVPSAKFDADAKSLEPTRGELRLEGASVQATAAWKDGVVTLDSLLSADETFARNHPELVADTTFQSIKGPLKFQGDVRGGRAKAASWTGSFELTAKGLKAPYVTVETATLPGKIADGVLTIDPVTAAVNGGSATGSATIGLAGEAPAHRLVLQGKDVGIDAELAPLLAHASPLFAIGEAGKTGGRTSADADLAATGLDAASLKKSMTGGGTVRLTDAYVESSRAWVGELMKFLGSSERLTIPSVTIPFKVHDSMVDTGEVPIEGAGLSMKLAGHAGLDGRLDYLMRVKTAGGGGVLAKFPSLLDKEGFLPLKLGGTISSPKLNLPDWQDAAKGALEDLLNGRKKKDEPPPPKPPKKKKADGGEESPPPAKDDDTPPPPPR